MIIRDFITGRFTKRYLSLLNTGLLLANFAKTFSYDLINFLEKPAASIASQNKEQNLSVKDKRFIVTITANLNGGKSSDTLTKISF